MLMEKTSPAMATLRMDMSWHGYVSGEKSYVKQLYSYKIHIE